MSPQIAILQEKKLLGKHRTMSFADDKTPELWRSFMTGRNKITNKLSENFFSINIFPENFDFGNVDPGAEFEKWAAAEVSDWDAIPEGMEGFILHGGLYAVFHHKGAADTAPRTFRYIFGEWLPNSEYMLDKERPHFEILGEKYKNGDPESEEEIWIPIMLKQ